MAVAWGPVRGRVVFDSAWTPLVEHAATGFSIMGGRNLLLTDHPAVYVHDSGGLSAAHVVALDPAAEPDASIALTHQSTRLTARVRLPGGKSVHVSTAAPLPAPVLAALAGLEGRLLAPAGATFVSPCAVSITPQYEDPTLPATELTAYVVVEGGRLELRGHGQVVLGWPVNRIATTPTGAAAVRVDGGAVLSGRLLTGAVLHLFDPRVRQAFLAAMAAAAPAPAAVGTSVPVAVRGLGADSTVDCVLGESVLELQAQGSDSVLARFDLTDARLRVAGSAERFVVFHPDSGPVAIRSDSDAFSRRLYAHPGLREAAEHTLATGPFPAELPDGEPVACAVVGEAVRAKGPGFDQALPFDDIRGVEGEAGLPRSRLRVVGAGTDLTVTGPLELVRSLHTEIVAGRNTVIGPRQLPDLLRAAAALEEDYFLYTIFGPFYELHAALLAGGSGTGGDTGEGSGLARPLLAPESDESRLRVAAGLTEGLTELQRHLDQVGAVLPAFVRHRDAQLLAAAGAGEPGWLKEQEAQLRSALAPVQRAAAETAAVAGQTARLLDLDPSTLPRPRYTGAAVTLGAAALLNPVFAVAGATQAYHQYSQSEQRKQQLGAQSARGWATVVDRWNQLLGTTLPVLGYVITEHVFGVRWEAARRITAHLRGLAPGAREPARRAVARRLARLDVMRRYPAGAGVEPLRGEIAEHLRATRDAISTPRFADF